MARQSGFQLSEEPSQRDEPNAFAPPTLSLPKGGGAIRSIGEKFTANPVTGTGSLAVPLAASGSRSAFGPQLSLRYDSGSGNGPFGWGWSLSLPSITRKTDKGLPQYRDAQESDEFLLSGAEDLVPVLLPDGRRFEDPVTVPGYTIHRYRPRVEGLFARIERWTDRATGETHWRSISRENVTSVYGRTHNSQISQPGDAARVFSWLICESYDDKGNAIGYEYAEENDDGIDRSQVHERNRTAASRSAQRYLRRIRYGNRVPNRDAGWNVTDAVLLDNWMFDLMFDYGEGYRTDVEPDIAMPEAEQHRYALAHAGGSARWTTRPDPFSSYRAGFEVRTYRLCRRVLMFHHFPEELGIADYLVLSTDFSYSESRFGCFLRSVVHSGYVHDPTPDAPNRYLTQSMPPLEFEYSQAEIGEEVREADADSLDNLPNGLDGSSYRFVDLDGEGVSGILTEQGTGWYYKRNLSPAEWGADRGMQRAVLRLGPAELVTPKPAAGLSATGTHLFDLAGDGQLDLVQLRTAERGFYERTDDGTWASFRPFHRFPNLDFTDPNLRLIDVDGDGHLDILVSQDDAFSWHPSLGEEGFGPAVSTRKPQEDDERGPRLVFADRTQSIYLADLSGDGLTDLVRIRNGEVCYWPNLGYGLFGAKVTMDDSPLFDAADEFDQQRVRVGDFDGSGTSDIIYLGRAGVTLWRNQSGNRWSAPRTLRVFPSADNLASVVVADLLGTGTACLVWSSPLPGYSRRLQYVDLMSGGKPHLLTGINNNLGSETRVRYAPSTAFFVTDRLAGRPWLTRLPFPVHVVERVDNYDHVSRSRLVTRYAYHHGYFDAAEREFRGFGMVEQFDTEELGALTAAGEHPRGDNMTEASHVPPVLTRTWFHTGAFVGRDRISNFFAGLGGAGAGEYYREPGLDEAGARARLLDDTALPDGLPGDEAREACRALKGVLLRQEIYSLDDTPAAAHPYRVSERSYGIRRLQARGANRHAVFFSHGRETIDYHYERNPADPRIGQSLTLEVDDVGNVLKAASIAYGRRQPDPAWTAAERAAQTGPRITYTERAFTQAISQPQSYRTPLPSEDVTYELTGYTPSGPAGRFVASDFVDRVANGFALTFDSEIGYHSPPGPGRQRRPIAQVRTYYRPDDLGAAVNDPLARLQLGDVEPLALPGQVYKLAFTDALLTQIFQRPQPRPGAGPLLPVPAAVLPIAAGQVADRGGYVDLDGDGRWWIPSGRVFYSPREADTPAQELAFARQHFFLAHRYGDPFGGAATVTFDQHRLLTVETRDPLDNRVTAGERNIVPALPLVRRGLDYRVLQPALVMDPNRNCSESAFDAIGIVVGTAVRGKPEDQPRPGDSLAAFTPNLTRQQIDDFFAGADPRIPGRALLGAATTRLVYDAERFFRSRRANPGNPDRWLPVAGGLLARDTHVSDLQNGQQPGVQLRFLYTDGLAREIQQKVLAEPGPVPTRDPATGRIVIRDGHPVMTTQDVSPRWVGRGWTVYNNKGQPVRRYEPFFTDTHGFEFDVRIGVSPVLFYDPLGRIVATVYPNQTYEKILFEPWRHVTWDANDTVLLDPTLDSDTAGATGRYFAALASTSGPWQTWYAARIGGALGPDEQDAAGKTALHANTPTAVHFDTLGRPFLTVADNGFAPDGTPVIHRTRIDLDIEGHERQVVDANGVAVVRYDYGVSGARIHEISMDAGERWTLSDIGGRPVRAWDRRGHAFRMEYDVLRRPIRTYVTGADAAGPNQALLTERLVYGEQYADGAAGNQRGAVALHLDQAGAVTTAYDFKGNPSRMARRLARDYRRALDWTAVDAALPADPVVPVDAGALEAALAAVVEAETFASRTTYDALNRAILSVSPHTAAMAPTVIRRRFSEANLLDSVDANVRGDQVAGQPVWTPFVVDIDYDAKGQRTRIEYGSGAAPNRQGATTTYTYDPLTFRLAALVTHRHALTFPRDCPQPPLSGWPGCGIQNLHYTYDPAGNITHVEDRAQAAVYFLNQRVDAGVDYTYDPIYQLVEAAAREHLGQVGGVPLPQSPDDVPRIGVWHRSDGRAMGRYIERYRYDPAGNLLEIQHVGSPANPNVAGWTRQYLYDEPSLIDANDDSNRLTSTTVGNGPAERYRYDAHGNTIRMPHLGAAHPDANLHWDYRDRLRQADLGGGGVAYYTYDAAGQRVRKVWEKAPATIEDRIYLGGFEIFRVRNAAGVVSLERETQHVTDDGQRLALVETRTLDVAGDDPAPRQLTRYQFGNHLGSAVLELDDRADVISYEEYYPYGSTSYQAVRSQTDTPKRYRYTAKERDQESGLYYHGARYYAPWLGRWASADPFGLIDGANLYRYSRNAPNRYRDTTGAAGEEVDNLNIGAERVVRHIGAESYLDYVEADAAGEDLVQQIAELIESSGNVTLNIAGYLGEEGQLYITDETLDAYFPALDELYDEYFEQKGFYEQIAEFVQGGEGRFTVWEVYHAIHSDVNVDVNVVTHADLGVRVPENMRDIRAGLERYISEVAFIAQPVRPIIPGLPNYGPVGPLALPHIPAQVPDNTVKPHPSEVPDTSVPPTLLHEPQLHQLPPFPASDVTELGPITKTPVFFTPLPTTVLPVVTIPPVTTTAPSTSFGGGQVGGPVFVGSVIAVGIFCMFSEKCQAAIAPSRNPYREQYEVY